jgi:hypothetical protein
MRLRKLGVYDEKYLQYLNFLHNWVCQFQQNLEIIFGKARRRKDPKDGSCLEKKGIVAAIKKCVGDSGSRHLGEQRVLQ